MNTLLFISILLLVIAVLVINRWNRRPSPNSPPILTEPRQFEGLFAEQHAIEANLYRQAEAKLRAEEERERLLERAAEGDETTLDAAHQRRDLDLYREVLRTLVTQANGQSEVLCSIAEYIVDSRQLRCSSEFAHTMTEIWSQSLDQRSLVDMLYLSALSDDAAAFQQALEVALKKWQGGKLPRVSAQDLLALVECAYWLVATEVRYSGSGFLIKRAIADVRRELAAANRQSA
jgi:hypothetical protein